MATLYLKYRPKNLNELDLKSVRETLSNYVTSDDIPHAYLFSGPKGTGKTSAARILAKVINCENRKKKSINPCNKCEQCTSITKGTNIDVIELDAASHRGIDDVRALREAVKLAPASANKKVYIIDEAHMLTTEASNALLKTLEEPPDHVVFVLATTNPEKLIGTIRSRTVNIPFKRATNEELVRSLSRVVKGERLKVDKKTLELIAKSADGSFRDAQKTLEQLVMDKIPLKQKNVEDFLKHNIDSDVEVLLEYLSERETKKALSEVEKCISNDISIVLFTQKLLGRLREALLTEVGVGENELKGFGKGELVDLIDLLSVAESRIKTSYLEQLPLELAVIKWCERGKGGNDGEREGVDDEFEDEFEDELSGKDLRDSRKPVKNDPKKIAQTDEVLDQTMPSTGRMTGDIWSKVLANIRTINTTTEALLRAAKPVEFNGDTLTLGVFYSFHKERLEETIHRRLVEDVVSKLLRSRVRVVCTLAKPAVKGNIKTEGAKESSVGAGVSPGNGSSGSDIPSNTSGGVLTEDDDEDIIRIAEEIFSV